MMMPEPLDNLYFNWLCAKVVRVDGVPAPSNTFNNLLRQLYNTEYVWLMVGDDNRAEDGLELRHEFLVETNFPDNMYWHMQPCSVLEMLIAFARRAEFQTDDSVRDWFWEFIDNLGLKMYSDAVSAESVIDEVIYKFVWRQYEYNGDGGLFPLNEPPEDQTKTEVWYQFCEYLIDRHREP